MNKYTVNYKCYDDFDEEYKSTAQFADIQDAEEFKEYLDSERTLNGRHRCVFAEIISNR